MLEGSAENFSHWLAEDYVKNWIVDAEEFITADALNNYGVVLDVKS